LGYGWLTPKTQKFENQQTYDLFYQARQGKIPSFKTP